MRNVVISAFVVLLLSAFITPVNAGERKWTYYQLSVDGQETECVLVELRLGRIYCPDETTIKVVVTAEPIRNPEFVRWLETQGQISQLQMQTE